MGILNWKNTIVLSLAMSLAACSTSKTTDQAEATDPTPTAEDAGTDAVPGPTADAPAVQPPLPAETKNMTPPSSTPVTDSGQMPDSYTVQDGDTLMKIAFETYGDIYKWKHIYEANKDKISNPNNIPKGSVLKIDRSVSAAAVDRNGEKYLIKEGDTLGKISGSVYGTESRWKELWENNKQLIHNPNQIFAGFYLYYQPAASKTLTTTEAPASAAPLAIPSLPSAPVAESAPAPTEGVGAPASPPAQ